MKNLEDISLYPRCDMAREDYMSLAGEWLFEYDNKDRGIKEKWMSSSHFSKKIKVPFGVEKSPSNILWYAKDFEFSKDIKDKKVLLHFGAVDYWAKVWLNGDYLGEHFGGYTPFYFEVEKYIKQKNLLVIRVEDTRSLAQPRGKQNILNRPFFVFYPPVSGIWQKVWLETAGEIYLERYELLPDIEKKHLNFTLFLKGENRDGFLQIDVLTPDKEKITEKINFKKTKDGEEIKIRVMLSNIHLWSPSHPYLYKLNFKVETDISADEVMSYSGIRKIEIKGNKIYLNNQLLYQKLLLCQGYFPRGGYTPLSDDVFKKDVELVKDMGFNGVRLHQKIENKNFLFWCDYLGCLVWEEMPSAYIWSKKTKDAVEKEWDEVIKRDFNHPSIIILVPFNESWGVGMFFIPTLLFPSARDTVSRIYYKTKKKNPHRLVIDNSGYDHIKTDIVDIHHYLEDIKKCKELYSNLKTPEKLKFSVFDLLKSINPGKANHPVFAPKARYEGQPIIISEYGGFGFYKTKGGETLFEKFKKYTELIMEQEHISGFCYTQFYDTYQEKNGLLNFDRTPKVDIKKIKEVLDKV